MGEFLTNVLERVGAYAVGLLLIFVIGGIGSFIERIRYGSQRSSQGMHWVFAFLLAGLASIAIEKIGTFYIQSQFESLHWTLFNIIKVFRSLFNQSIYITALQSIVWIAIWTQLTGKRYGADIRWNAITLFGFIIIRACIVLYSIYQSFIELEQPELQTYRIEFPIIHVCVAHGIFMIVACLLFIRARKKGLEFASME